MNVAKVADAQAKTAAGQAVGGLIGTLGGAIIAANVFCWVAREVYGEIADPRWFIFRMWVRHEAPEWFLNYMLSMVKHTLNLLVISHCLNGLLKRLMDLIVERKELNVKVFILLIPVSAYYILTWT